MLYLKHIVIFGMINSSKSNREKVLMVFTVSVALCATIFMVIIEPQLKEHKARSMRMNQLRVKLTKMNGDLLVKDRIGSVYAQIESLITSSGTDQQEISLFTRELSDLYSKRNVKTRTIKVLPIADEEFYKRLSVKIEMSGQIKEILNLITSIEKHPNPIRIEQFDIKSREVIDNVEASFVITKVVTKPEDKDS